MNEWNLSSLENVCKDVSYGYTESAVWDSSVGPKFLRITDIQNDSIDWDKVPHCPIKPKNFEKYQLQKGDIVIARTGNSTGANAIINEDLKAVFASFLIRFRIDPEIADPFFIGHLLRSYSWKGYVKSVASGSAQPGANAKQLGGFSFGLPPIETQNRIANLLNLLDDKINLLRAQNKNLEQLAQTLFKQWFMDFEFPNEEGRPYKSSGGKMEESELGEIPEGWKISKIKNLVDKIIDYRGKTPKKLGMDWTASGIPALSAKIIKAGKIVRRDAINYGSEDLYKKWMKDELRKDDILLTSEAPLGEMYYLCDDTKYILSQRLFALRTNTHITSSYLYFYLFSFQGQYLLKRRASGSTVQGIRQSELKEVEVVVPQKETLELATIIFKDVLYKQFNNSKELETLTETRNTLLPKLMSGEVRVNHFNNT